MRLDGGNKYKEGIEGFTKRSWKGDRVKGKLSSLATLDPSPSRVRQQAQQPAQTQHQESQEIPDIEEDEVEEVDDAQWDEGPTELWDEQQAEIG